MIRRLPLAPIQLAYLVLLTYFSIYYLSWLALVMLVVSLFLLWGNSRAVLMRSVLVVLAFAGLFGYRVYRAEQANRSAPIQLTSLAVIPDSIQVNGDSLSFRGQASGQTYQAFYKLTSPEEQAFFQYLTQPVTLIGEISLTQADSQRNFSGFDYRAYLKSQNIYRVARVSQIRQVQSRPLTSPLDGLRLLRQKALVSIKTKFPQPMSHYMTGLLFGHLDKSFDEMADLYSSLGIIHLFALSGMQVGFFLGWFRKLLLRLGLTVGQVDALQLPFSLIYAGLTGFQVSVIRSLLQAFFSRLGIKGLDNLGLTVLSLFILIPNAFLTAGGVLSCTYALVLTILKLDDLSGWRRSLAESLVLSLAVLPVLIWYTASFQPLSLVLTALLSLLFDGLMLPLLSLVAVLSPLVRLESLNPLFILLEQVLGALGQWLSRPLVLGRPSLLVLVSLLVLLGFLYDYRRQKKLAVSLSIVIALLFALTKHPLDNEVTVVDVGQGDSIFLRDAWGKTLLIDVGGRVDFGTDETWRRRQTDSNASRTLLPYLKSRGVGRIDQLVLTHTDTDHIGDLEAVARELVIGEVLVSQGSLTDEDFVTRLKALGVRVRVLTAGDRLPIMGSHLQVLYPWSPGDGGNNDSLVLYGRLLDKNFLFTGDLEEGELDLVQRYPNLPVDVLKAGHHGSKGSSYPEFLTHIKADMALVSAGKNNRYQHPHQETLERFEDAGMAVYRTDEQGAIRFRGWWAWQIETVR